MRFSIGVCFLWVSCSALAGEPGPALSGEPPKDAAGYPSSNTGLDPKQGFAAPPHGYGEVPFWWWTGDPLDKERLLWQLDQLQAVGCPGVQINYAHDPSMTTYAVEPPIFSEAWWDVFSWMAGECRKRNMGIGLSGYTIDWPGRGNLFRKIGITDGSLRGASLAMEKKSVEGGIALEWLLPEPPVSVMAYHYNKKTLKTGSDTDLRPFMKDQTLIWTPPKGRWEVVAVFPKTEPYSVDPMRPESGKKTIEKFFQPFVEHCPGDAAKALNYFFQDELNFGLEGWLWNDRFTEEFAKRKGYDILPLLPALFVNIGPITPKVRLDYSDVMVALSEECYFKPIFDWHWQRGLIYACDSGGRGQNPLEFGDYFRAVRWYTAPGHDTPGGKADLRKNKVSSSISHLYQRPRVWLEGYHSLGWGATPAAIFDSTCRNFLYGANLLNLHGLYYTTHGSFWEWAPPCYHFRMPYWEHMRGFFNYFERLSYLLSQGVHHCDVAVMYPVAPMEADMGGEVARELAFKTGCDLFEKHGLDFDFMDFESLARAEIRDRQLCVSGEAYRVLILPGMRALRYSTLRKAIEFYRAGGVVLAVGALPEASDRMGGNDPELDAVVKEMFGVTAAVHATDKKADVQKNSAGGFGAAAASAASLAEIINSAIPRDFIPEGPAQVLHRHIGSYDVFMVMGAAKNSSCFFRAKGNVELWNPWTGERRPVLTRCEEQGGTRVQMPLDTADAQIIVFSPDPSGPAVAHCDLDEVASVEQSGDKTKVVGYANSPGTKRARVIVGGKEQTLQGEAQPSAPPLELEGPWEFELKPVMNNRWGDFRLPVVDTVIGPEARRFAYAEEQTPNPGWQAPATDTSTWRKETHSFGQRFWKLGPLPADADMSALEKELAKLNQVDAAKPVSVNGREYAWQPYAYSTRWGVEGDPGPQGHHGLKEKVSDDFIALGKPDYTGIEIEYQPEPGGTRYYLWTTARAGKAGNAKIRLGGLQPGAVYINESALQLGAEIVALHEGANPVLLRFDQPGRTHFVLEMESAATQKEKTPLAMSWYDNPGVVAFDALPERKTPAGWYRFVSPPGLNKMRFAVHGNAQVWAEGTPMTLIRGDAAPDGARAYEAVVANPSPKAVVVALRIEQDRGYYGGAVFPGPVRLECSPGEIETGDWANVGVLEHYSGGAWYRKTVTLTDEQCRGRVMLNLGNVVATAEVHVNGTKAGLCLTPPWKMDISSFVKPGENRIEILVCNTLSNHYGTIPTHYRGSPLSGLLGPVTIETMQSVVLQ
ncbi:MAG TPA: glycosyl hydrolase [Candidatus Hydrogenedentes bacterium]|nr:glycosyl hydrolase [Candidatus Hydrogenedentota bacterium]